MARLQANKTVYSVTVYKDGMMFDRDDGLPILGVMPYIYRLAPLGVISESDVNAELNALEQAGFRSWEWDGGRLDVKSSRFTCRAGYAAGDSVRLVPESCEERRFAGTDVFEVLEASFDGLDNTWNYILRHGDSGRVIAVEEPELVRKKG